MIDASATTTNFNQAVTATTNQSAKRKSSILIQAAPVSINKVKGSTAYRVSNMRMSPLNKFLKDSVPQSSAKH